jgi:phage gp29-like protein
MADAIATRRRLEGIYQTVVADDDFVKEVSKRDDTYKRMKRDPHVSSVWQSRTYPVACAPWRIESENEAQATALTEQLTKWPKWPKYNIGIMDAIFRGWAGWELVFHEAGAKVLVRDHIQIDQDFITFTPDGAPRLLTTDHPYEGIPMPSPQFGVASWGDQRQGNPRGEGLGKSIFWHWFMKVKGLKFWAQALERFGSPGLKAKVEGGDLAARKARWKEILRDYIQGTGVVYSEGEEVDVLASIGKVGDSHKLFEDFCNDEISKVVLSQTLTTQPGASGSYALGKVQSGVRDDIQWSDSLWLASIHEDFTLPALGGLLFGDAYVPAHFEFIWEDLEEVKANTERIKVLSEIKVPLRSEDVYRSIGFPKPEQGDDVFEWPKAPAPIINPALAQAGNPTPPPAKKPEMPDEIEETDKHSEASGTARRLAQATRDADERDVLALASVVAAVREFERGGALDNLKSRLKKKR